MNEETIELCNKYVYSLARKYCSNPSDLEDLIQVGNIGLVLALKNYKKDSRNKRQCLP